MKSNLKNCKIATFQDDLQRLSFHNIYGFIISLFRVSVKVSIRKKLSPSHVGQHCFSTNIEKNAKYCEMRKKLRHKPKNSSSFYNYFAYND
jgi:hypothetical protein